MQPALAVIDELRRRDLAIEFLYVGSQTGIEATLALESGIPFRSVTVGKLRRSSKGLRGLLTAKNATDLLRVPVGIVQAMWIVRRFKPDAVLGTGGYVSVPTILASGLQRIPVLTHEQTVTIGLANRLCGRFSTRIALTFEGSRGELPRKLWSRAFVTGNPLRTEIFSGDRTRAISTFGFDVERSAIPCVYVTGGAQGSRILNRGVQGAAEVLLRSSRVLHQCGAADALEMMRFAESLPADLRGRYRIRPFIGREEIGDAFALADVVVSRAGAGTVTELSALGKPAVFVPLEPSSRDEQLRNAQRLVQAGGAVLVRQADFNADSLLAAVQPLLESESMRRNMSTSLQALSTPNATGDLAGALLELGSR